MNCFSTNTNSCSFKNFHEEIMKQNKPNSSAAIKANLGCVQQFRCVSNTTPSTPDQLKPVSCELTVCFICRDVLNESGHLFVEDVRQNCLRVLSSMKESAHAYLLHPVYESLKVSSFTWTDKQHSDTSTTDRGLIRH